MGEVLFASELNPLLSTESGDVKATIAVLSFILSSAAKHNVDSESLSSELQQLGLPKEHATGLCRSYEEKQSPLQDSLRACSLRCECGSQSYKYNEPLIFSSGGRCGSETVSWEDVFENHCLLTAQIRVLNSETHKNLFLEDLGCLTFIRLFLQELHSAHPIFFFFLRSPVASLLML
uniref:COMM domain containing 4 n=1 Tax=Dromaius novaehollandiae TaxID=8790 RepID=A0A8C4J2W6_DRONO